MAVMDEDIIWDKLHGWCKVGAPITKKEEVSDVPAKFLHLIKLANTMYITKLQDIDILVTTFEKESTKTPDEVMKLVKDIQTTIDRPD